MDLRRFAGFFLFVITLLFLAGCGTQEGFQERSPFVGGVEALSASFIPGAPPDAVMDNSQFPFGVSVWLTNLGEYDIASGSGYVEIVGINPADFGTTAAALKQPLPAVRGARKNFDGTVIEGEQTVVSFDNLNYQEDVVGNFDGPIIRANMCYDYGTRASAYLCVKRDLLTNIQTKEICDITGEKLVSNSGGPIQIIGLRQNPLGNNKIQVQFTVAHVGATEDRFYMDGQECDDTSTYLYKDKVYVDVVSDINGRTAECTGLQTRAGQTTASNEGYVTLFNGAPRIVVCSFNLENIDFVANVPIIIEMKYRYFQFIEKPLIVQDVTTAQ